ncbi:hypothetical protein [Saccharothrix sp. HUAS TT1]|uniref:hypothetical protein n=1 Tax=unclassified Saccharothrix TaxID=2593673 RepID=UPI00345BC83F
MTTYERVNDQGRVVERVTPVPGDHEDTRLGVAVLESAGGWRVQGGEVEQADPHGEDPPPADPPSGAPSTEPSPVMPMPRVGPRRADTKKEA